MMNPNDGKLVELLKSVRVPERSTAYWQDFPKRITVRLRTSEPNTGKFPVSPSVSRTSHSTWARGLGLATACLVIGFGIGFWKGNQGKSSPTPNQVAANKKLFREMAALFPNQIRAIVSDEKGVHLILSEKTDVPNSAPLFLEICEGGKCQYIITFSGQQIQLKGEKCDVLSDPHGNVMIVGPHWYWSDAHASRPIKHYRIHAQPLETSL